MVSRTGKINISLSAFAPENLVSRDGFGSPVPRQPAHLHTHKLNPVLTGFLPSSAAAPIYLFKQPYAIESVPSLSGHATAYRWRSSPRVRRHRANKPQGIVPNGCCLGRYHRPAINMRLSFSRPLLVRRGHVVVYAIGTQ